jgi:hypothetical protein
VGDEVRLEASIEVPVGAGGAGGIEWDFEAPASCPSSRTASTRRSPATRRWSHTGLRSPGTYFPVVRVTNQRSADFGTPHCRIFNLGRVRVVVR